MKKLYLKYSKYTFIVVVEYLKITMFKDVQQLKINQLENDLRQLKVEQKLGLKDAHQKMQHVQQLIWRVAQATTLAELDMNPNLAMTFLKEHGVVPVLDDSDYVITERARNYHSRAELITVHQMKYAPLRSRLTTPAETKVVITDTVQLNEKSYQYCYQSEYNYVHFSLNGARSNQDGQYWVLQPLVEIPANKIAGMTPNNTYTYGGVNLTENAWILCPWINVTSVQKHNPHVHVLGYKGENAVGLVNSLISQLGYRVEKIEQWGWSDYSISQQQLLALAAREKIPAVSFYQSTEYEDERFQTSTNKIIAILKMLLNENLVRNVEDFKQLRPQLFTKTNFHFVIKNLMRTSIVQNDAWIKDDAIVAKHRQVSILAKKMAQANFPMSTYAQMALQVQMEDSNSVEANKVRNGLSCVEFATRLLVNTALQARTAENKINLQ